MTTAGYLRHDPVSTVGQGPTRPPSVAATLEDAVREVQLPGGGGPLHQPLPAAGSPLPLAYPPFVRGGVFCGTRLAPIKTGRLW